MCPDLSAPVNGKQPMCTFSVDYNAVCTFECNSGFGIVGESQLTCGGDGSTADGIYDYDPPTCEGKNNFC